MTSDIMLYFIFFLCCSRGLDELTGEEIWLLAKVNYETPDRIHDFLDRDLKIDTLLLKSRLVWALTDLLV